MKLNSEIENIILKANLRTNMDIMVTDDEKIVYYIGNTDKCKKYIYTKLSEELKKMSDKNINEIKFLEEEETVNIIENEGEKYTNQAIYTVHEEGKFERFIIFNKEGSKFDDGDRLIINSTIYLINKYLLDCE